MFGESWGVYALLWMKPAKTIQRFMGIGTADSTEGTEYAEYPPWRLYFCQPRKSLNR
jgi:hypothetical protein